MTALVHRWLTFLGSATVLVSGVLGGSNLISPQLASWLAAGAAIVPVLATYWRANFPDQPVNLTGRD